MASPSSLISGDVVTVTWAGIAVPSTSDWIALHVPGTSDGNYIRFQFTGSSASSGSMAFLIPSSVAAGTYELRLFSNNTMVLLAISNPFAVTACPTGTLNSSPLLVAPGGTITATWGGVCFPTSTDWIALHQAATADVNFVSWIWGSGTASGSLPFPIPSNLPAGTYELRMYANNTSNRLSVGNSFQVAP